MKKNVLMKWIVVDDICSCLIFENGNPLDPNDRVALIEKSPRVFINGEWIQGPKGEGGNILQDEYTIYGFDSSSCAWCQEMLKEHYTFVFDTSLFIQLKNNLRYSDLFMRKLYFMNNSSKFFNSFYFSPEQSKTVVSVSSNESIYLPSFSSLTKEAFLADYDKKMKLFRDSLEKSLDNKLSSLNSLSKIEVRSTSIIVSGLKQEERNISLLHLFDQELKNTKVAVMYRGVLQNKIDSDNVVFFKYNRKSTSLIISSKYCDFFIQFNKNYINHNLGHSLRKVMKKDNLYDILKSLIHQYSISVV